MRYMPFYLTLSGQVVLRYWRMSDELPHAWEQKTIAIEGVVASVPEATQNVECISDLMWKKYQQRALLYPNTSA